MIRKTYYTENNNKANEIIQQIIDFSNNKPSINYWF